MSIFLGRPWMLGGANNGNAAAAPSYTGPGDVVSGATAWWGLRAYSLAKAGTAAVRIIRASDSTQQDFNTLANGNLDIASIATFLTSTTGKIVTLYDQTGNGWNLTQATDGNRPAYTASIIGSLSGITFNAATFLNNVGGFSSMSQPFTGSGVINPGSGSAQMGLPYVPAAKDRGFYIVTNKIGSYWSTALEATATAGSWYTFQLVANNASSVDTINGSDTTGTTGTSDFTGANLRLGWDSGTITMKFAESGVWPSGFSSGNRTSMDSNQRAYWGF